MQTTKAVNQHPMQCFTVGTHSHCLRGWEHPTREMSGFFHEVKVIQTNRGPKKDGERKVIIIFYGTVSALSWDPNRLRWIDGGQFLEYTTKSGRDVIINKNPGTTCVADKW